MIVQIFVAIFSRKNNVLFSQAYVRISHFLEHVWELSPQHTTYHRIEIVNTVPHTQLSPSHVSIYALFLSMTTEFAICQSGNCAPSRTAGAPPLYLYWYGAVVIWPPWALRDTGKRTSLAGVTGNNVAR